MQKLNKILKWTGISIGSLIALFILLAIALPKTSVTSEEKVSDVTSTLEVIADTSPAIVTEQPQPVVTNKSTPSKIEPKTVEKTIVPEPQKPTPATYRVVSVVDGDTIKVNINGTTETIRIIGINTPETVDPRKPVECFGKEASNKAKELLTGKTVTLEIDPSQGERDKYNRSLRYVFLSDGTDYGKYMISSGYAYEYTYNTPYKYQSGYKAAQVQAQSSKTGLWATNTCNGSTVNTQTQPAISGNYYTSSYSTSKYYYPASCEAWKSLDSKYLKSFTTLDALLVVYPKRTLSSQCK